MTASPVTPISAVPVAELFAAMREVLLVVDGPTSRARPVREAQDGCGDDRVGVRGQPSGVADTRERRAGR
ncbi:hypothetical protein CBZ_19730 [Cellulomonas biazotea]|jgi:hypothetical protein|uniref:Uncharacterized protein n=1 Tax=Cellulomonas biazotea TaxID=1709 RepID=A0A402DS21_9CELL|nr:hypothetical protein CBZ_19730 [Cellulomonas biazotea]